MNFQKWSCFALFAFLLATHSQTILASNHLDNNGEMPSVWTLIAQTIQSSWVVTASLGPGWENSGEAQTFFLTPEIEKTFTANHSSHTLINGELF